MMLAVAATTGGWWSQHAAHVLLIAVPALLIGGIGLWADIRGYLNRRHDL